MLDLEKCNLEIQAWATDATNQMKGSAAAAGVQHRADSPSQKASLQQLVARYKIDAGLVHIVSFKFPRALIWTHKGAGKGMAGQVGSSWADKHGSTHRTDPASKGKMNTGARKEKPFFNNTLTGPGGVDQLGEIVATHLGDAIVNNLLIK